MKSSKRALALFMSLVFVLTSAISISATAADFSDVDEKHMYNEAITTLVEDGIVNGYEDGTFKPDNTITRAEFSKLLAAASAPSGTMFSATTTKFSDVADSTSPSAWAIPYIAYAVGTGAINGYEDGTFRPTNPVTYGEAVKMIVCTLGYEPVVDKTLTPWYQGYVDIAAQIGLSKNAFAMGDTPANRGLVAQLIYNMLGCDVLVQTGTDALGNPIYGTGGMGGSGGSSLDEQKDNATAEEGVVLGVIDYSLTGQVVKKSQVLIDNNLYGIGSYDVDTLKEYVGYAVSFKYNAKNELTKVSRLSGENDVITVEDWQIDSVTSRGMDYYANEYDEKTTTISFNDMYVIYNGAIVDVADIGEDFDLSERLDVKDGSIKFISNDGNAKTAEVAIVESYETYFANTPSHNNGISTIYDQFTAVTGLPTLTLDEDDVASVKRVTTKGGTAQDSNLTAIAKNAVVSVAVPYDAESQTTKVVFSTAVVTKGEVKEMASDYSYIKIGSEEYEVAPYFELLLEAGKVEAFSTNDVGKFYLDRLGRIVYFEKTESTNPYALAVRYRKTTDMDAKYALDLYISGSSGTTTYPLKDKVKFNNGSSLEAADVVAHLEDVCPNDYSDFDDIENGIKYIVQPIKYQTSVSGGDTVISAIECIDGDNGGVIPFDIPDADNNGKLTFSKSGYTFKDNNVSQFSLNTTSSIVYVVPSDVTDVKAFRKYSYSYFSEGSYNVEAYDVEKGSAKVVLRYLEEGQTTDAAVYTNTPVYFIESINSAKDEYDQIVKKITYYKAGSDTLEDKLTDYDADFGDLLDTLQPGDLVKMAFTDGKITAMKTVFVDGTLTDKTAPFYNGNKNYISAKYDSIERYYEVITGTVFTIDSSSNVLKLIPEYIDTKVESPAWESFNLDSSVKYYKYNTKAESYELLSDGAIFGYEAFVETAPEQASEVVAIVMNKKVVAVYILE